MRKRKNPDENDRYQERKVLGSIERKLCCVNQKMRGDKKSKDKEENDAVTMRRPDIHQVAMHTYAGEAVLLSASSSSDGIICKDRMLRRGCELDLHHCWTELGRLSSVLRMEYSGPFVECGGSEE